MDISPEALNSQDTIHISNDSQEKGRRGQEQEKACSCIVGEHQDREVGGGMRGEWAEGRGLRELMGRGEPGKGKSYGM